MRKIALVAAAALIPLIPTAPAYAADHVICVNDPVGATCDQSVATIQQAITAANANSVDDTILLAPGSYTDGPYLLNGSAHHVTLQGAGLGSTTISAPTNPANEQYLLVANTVSVQDLTVDLNSSSATFDAGIAVDNAVLHAVRVDGSNTQDKTGITGKSSTISAVAIDMTLAAAASNTGIYGIGANTVSDTTIVAADGFFQAAPEETSTLSRLSIASSIEGIHARSGTIQVDDTVVDLGTSASGIALGAYNLAAEPFPQAITANHVTIVGGGANSTGALARASAATALQHASIQLTNSIVAGPATDLWAEAGNDGLQGAKSTATVTTSYSDWSTLHQNIDNAFGTATVDSGAGHLDVDPGFRNAASGDFRLNATSPVIDRGAPGTGTPSLDLVKGARVLDGNADGIAVRDMGAYEAPKKVDTTAPNTTLASHPKKRTTKRRVTFEFTSNESHVTFQCRLDKKAWGACTSPKRLRVTKGWHVFKVRAVDAAGNVDPTPARFRFHRV